MQVATEQQPERNLSRRRLLIGGSAFLASLLLFGLLVSLDLIFTKPRDFSIDSAVVDFAATSPTANATVGIEFQPNFSKVLITNAVCELESGPVYINIEALPSEGSTQRYRLNANVDTDDLQSHGDLAWKVSTGQNEEPALLGCSIDLKIWIGHFIPIKYTYTVTELNEPTFGESTSGSNSTEVGEGPTLGDVDESKVQATVSGDVLMLTYKPTFAIPESVPVQVLLPGFVLSAGTATSRTIVVQFEGANIQDLSDAGALTAVVVCDGECAWYSPLVDVVLEGGGTIEVTVDAEQSFVEYVLGRHHDVVISRKRKSTQSRRRLEHICSLTCLDLTADGANGDLCLGFQLSEGMVIEGQFEAFGATGMTVGDIKWEDLEDEDGINVYLNSVVSFNEDIKIDLKGNLTAVLGADDLQVSSAIVNSADNWPIVSRLQSLVVLNDDIFSIRIDDLYLMWKDVDLINTQSAFSIDFVDESLNGMFSNTAPDWPLQSSTSASFDSFDDEFFSVTLDQARLTFRNDMLVDTVGRFTLDLGRDTLELVATDPAYEFRLNGSLLNDELTFSASLDVDGVPTIMSAGSGSIRELDQPEGFEVEASSTLSVDGKEELDLSAAFTFLFDNFDTSLKIANTAGRWPMEFSLSGVTLDGSNSFLVSLDELSLRFQDRLIMDTVVFFNVEIGGDFDLIFVVTDPSFSIESVVRLEIADDPSQPEYSDVVNGTLSIQIDDASVLDFVILGEILWSNVNDGFKVSGSVDEEALLGLSFRTDLDVKSEYDGVLGIDRVDTNLEQFLLIVDETAYADVVGSMKLGFDNQRVQFSIQNTAQRNIRVATSLTWETDTLPGSIEISVAQTTIEVSDRNFIDVTGRIFLQDTDERNYGELEWQTVDDAARVQSGATIVYQVFRTFGFGLRASLTDGILLFDNNQLIDWEMSVEVRDGEEALTGEFSVVSENQEAFVQVNTLLGFQVDDSVTARIAPFSLVIDSSVVTDLTADVFVSPNMDGASIGMGYHASDKKNGFGMSMDDMAVDWPDSTVSMSMDGVSLALPGRSSPLINGGMDFEIDFDQKVLEFSIENDSTLQYVNTSFVVDFGAVVGGETDAHDHECQLPNAAPVLAAVGNAPVVAPVQSPEVVSVEPNPSPDVVSTDASIATLTLVSGWVSIIGLLTVFVH